MKTPDGKSRVYKIKAFEKTSAANFKFDVEGKKVSVAVRDPSPMQLG